MSDPGPRIILASGSPRRRELLGGMGVPFEIVTAAVIELDGGTAPDLTPADLARENARRKARAVADARPGRWVLGADTVVAVPRRVHRVRSGVDEGGKLRARMLGKPGSLAEAAGFLQLLSGQEHEVITGCALFSPEGDEEIFHDMSRVIFRELTKELIASYLAAVDVLDKAGGYALQEKGEWIIERVEGSRTNVVGLPTERLETVLKRRGLL